MAQLAKRRVSTLLTAASHGGVADVDGHPIDLGATIATRDDRNIIRRWLWTVTLAEGIRALARAGRWEDALSHAERHHGIGATLLDGRQIAVLAHTLRGDHSSARALLAESVQAEQWHDAVAHALGLLISRYIGTPTRSDQNGHMDLDFLDRDSASTATFRTEVGLAIVLLTDDATSSATLHELTHKVAKITDAALARVVLAHPAHSHLPAPLLDHLTTMSGAAFQPRRSKYLRNALTGALNGKEIQCG